MCNTLFLQALQRSTFCAFDTQSLSCDRYYGLLISASDTLSLNVVELGRWRSPPEASLYLCKLLLLTRNHQDFSKIPGLLIEVVTV
ncbi:hypothetical protein [Tolypothrix sp. VBCCA 56010]|uniref:hypothetical protein n=1 Tax=Tolypothrix sp. VBCCA 56010 TaxID=3137731 RepID=UPI003D7E1B5E